MKRNLLTLVIGIVLVLIFGLLLVSYQVRVSEVAVVTTFGKPTTTRNDPGFYLKLPWPIQKVHKFDKRVLNFEDMFSENFTADGSALNVMVFVGWRITKPDVFFPKFKNGSIVEAEKALEEQVRSEKSAAIGKHPLTDFVNVDEKSLKFNQIEQEIKTRVQEKFKEADYGLEIQFLGIKKLGLPEAVTQAVFDRMTSDRKNLADKIETEGVTQASNIRSGADTKASEMRSIAEGEAKRISSEGEAAAAELLPVFQKNPELALFLFGLESLEQSLKERSILILDQRTPPFDMLGNLPGSKANK